MERIFQIIAAALLITAAYLLWRGVTDWSFVCGVLAACAFFLSMRFQIKGRMAERTAAEAEDFAEEQPSITAGDENTAADLVENTSADTTLHS